MDSSVPKEKQVPFWSKLDPRRILKIGKYRENSASKQTTSIKPASPSKTEKQEITPKPVTQVQPPKEVAVKPKNLPPKSVTSSTRNKYVPVMHSPKVDNGEFLKEETLIKPASSPIYNETEKPELERPNHELETNPVPIIKNETIPKTPGDIFLYTEVHSRMPKTDPMSLDYYLQEFEIAFKELSDREERLKLYLRKTQTSTDFIRIPIADGLSRVLKKNGSTMSLEVYKEEVRKAYEEILAEKKIKKYNQTTRMGIKGYFASQCSKIKIFNSKMVHSFFYCRLQNLVENLC